MITPAEAMAAQPPQHSTGQWFDMPKCAYDWLPPGDRRTYWLPPTLSASDELAAHEQLARWDALAGLLLRETLFSDPGGREMRQCAEAVAAVAEQLAVRLGARIR